MKKYKGSAAVKCEIKNFVLKKNLLLVRSLIWRLIKSVEKNVPLWDI